MKQKLMQVWQARSPRDRTILVVLAILIVAALYAALFVSANKARPQLRASVLALRTDAARLNQFAEEIERLRGIKLSTGAQTDLRSLVQSQAEQAGLASSLVRLDAPEANRVQIVFGAVPFPDWLGWVVALNSQKIRLDTCRIEGLSKPGMVSVTATFVRSGQQ